MEAGSGQNTGGDKALMSEDQQELIESKDYYWEGLYMVFTAEYLNKRGYCCQSGCRHCPYGNNNSSEEPK